jgi:hypothetical protein
MLGGTRDPSDSRQKLVDEIKKLPFLQRANNSWIRWASLKSYPLWCYTMKNDRLRHLNTAVDALSSKLVSSLLTRRLSFLNTEFH